MTWSGALLGATAALGGWLAAARVQAVRRGPTLQQRVAPYLGTVAPASADLVGPTGVVGLVLPVLRRAAARLDAVLGGSEAVRVRLVRSAAHKSVADFRLEQLVWGAAAFGVALVLLVVVLASGGGPSPVAGLVLCLAAALGGVIAREQVLQSAVRTRVASIEAEFPALAELLALAVAAGEGVSGAIDRVTRVCSGELSGELARALADLRAGDGLGESLRAMADRLDVAPISRFVDGVSIAVERGTPLADVLRAQASDARDLRRRRLMEIAGRREIAMLVPVVFLILPVTVVFALFPGFYGLNLSVN